MNTEDREREPGLVAFYDIQPGNGLDYSLPAGALPRQIMVGYHSISCVEDIQRSLLTRTTKSQLIQMQTNATQTGALINSNIEKTTLRQRTDRAWFSCRL